MSAIKLEPYIETYTGKKFYFLNPTPAMISIHDIAHSLAHQCRFSGHTKVFYSVAQHCLRVSEHSPPEFALTGLLHDASEAYIHDIPSPVKPYLENYHALENNIMEAIAKKFGIEWPVPAAVKEADSACLKAEARELLPSKRADWVDHYPTSFEVREVNPTWVLTPQVAKREFLARAMKLLWGVEREVVNAV
jgi:5'-deoxynucleotidase YfbR-like HD superfamily hydrolase